MRDTNRIWGSEEIEEVGVIDRIFGQRKREVQICEESVKDRRCKIVDGVREAVLRCKIRLVLRI